MECGNGLHVGVLVLKTLACLGVCVSALLREGLCSVEQAAELSTSGRATTKTTTQTTSDVTSKFPWCCRASVLWSGKEALHVASDEPPDEALSCPSSRLGRSLRAQNLEMSSFLNGSLHKLREGIPSWNLREKKGQKAFLAIFWGARVTPILKKKKFAQRTLPYTKTSTAHEVVVSYYRHRPVVLSVPFSCLFSEIPKKKSTSEHSPLVYTKHVWALSPSVLAITIAILLSMHSELALCRFGVLSRHPNDALPISFLGVPNWQLNYPRPSKHYIQSIRY